jgi:hypothetical protein
MCDMLNLALATVGLTSTQCFSAPVAYAMQTKCTRAARKRPTYWNKVNGFLEASFKLSNEFGLPLLHARPLPICERCNSTFKRCETSTLGGSHVHLWYVHYTFQETVGRAERFYRRRDCTLPTSAPRKQGNSRRPCKSSNCACMCYVFAH